VAGGQGRCRLKRVESRAESAWFQRLKIRCDELLSKFAFTFNYSRRYIKAPQSDDLQPSFFILINAIYIQIDVC